MMDDDGAFLTSRRAAATATVAIALEDRFAKPSEVFLVLPLQRIAGRTEAQRKDLRSPAGAAKRELDSSLPHRYSLDFSRDSLSRMNVSISDAFPRIRSHCSL
jgi:hypothetical protein